MSQSGCRIVSNQEKARCRNLVAETIAKRFNQPLECLSMLMPIANTLFEAASTSRPENAFKTERKSANYLKFTELTIYRLAGAKKIPFFKIRGPWRVSKVEIHIWIKQQFTTTN